MMRAKAIAVAAAIAFVGAVGSASAAERFSTLGGTPAEPLTAAEMASIKGSNSFTIDIIFGSGNLNAQQLRHITAVNHHIKVVILPGQGASHPVSQSGSNRGPGNNNGKNN